MLPLNWPLAVFPSREPPASLSVSSSKSKISITEPMQMIVRAGMAGGSSYETRRRPSGLFRVVSYRFLADSIERGRARRFAFKRGGLQRSKLIQKRRRKEKGQFVPFSSPLFLLHHHHHHLFLLRASSTSGRYVPLRQECLLVAPGPLCRPPKVSAASAWDVRASSRGHTALLLFCVCAPTEHRPSVRLTR